MDRCPLRFVTAQSIRAMRFFRFFQMGWLPNGGGILDQPATFVEAMEYLSAEMTKQEKERADESGTRRHPQAPR